MSAWSCAAPNPILKPPVLTSRFEINARRISTSRAPRIWFAAVNGMVSRAAVIRLPTRSWRLMPISPALTSALSTVRGTVCPARLRPVSPRTPVPAAAGFIMFAIPRMLLPSVHGLSAGVIIRVNSLRNDEMKLFAPRDRPAPMPALTAITAT